MRGIDANLRASVRQWVEYAEDDLRVAQHNLTMGDQCPPQIVAYHAQQCVEKYLKGFLVLRGVDFPYTHSITWLFELCEENGASLSDLREAEELTAYATATRYPSQGLRISKAQAERAIELANKVRLVMRQMLDEFGISNLP